MSPKSISHFAVLSILLTLSHSIGSAAVSSNSIASMTEEVDVKKSTKGSVWNDQKFLGRKITSKNTKPVRKAKDSSEKSGLVKGKSSSSLEDQKVQVPAQCVENRSLPDPAVSALSKDKRTGDKKAKGNGGESLKLANPFKIVGKALYEDQVRKSRDKKAKISQSRKALINKSSALRTASVNAENKEYSKKEVEDMIASLARAKRVSNRKSAREAALTNAEKSRIVRDHSVTSTLRFDKERAAEVKKNRDEKRRSQQSKAKESPRKVSSQGGVRTPANKGMERRAASEKGRAPAEQQTDGSMNNLSSYDAVRFRCNETDWPCSSCVTKRRAHRGISVCTMVVTVIAMIVSAIIIVNASDSEEKKPGEGNGTPGVPGVPGPQGPSKATAAPSLKF